MLILLVVVSADRMVAALEFCIWKAVVELVNVWIVDPLLVTLRLVAPAWMLMAVAALEPALVPVPPMSMV